MLATIFLHQILPAIENRVRRKMTEEEKEWLVLVPLDEFHRLQIQPVRQILTLAQTILRQVNPRDPPRAKHVREKVRPIPHALHLAARVPAKAMVRWPQFELRPVMFVAREMPLAHHARGILVLRQNLRQRHLADRQRVGGIRPQVIDDAHPRRMLPREQRRAIRRTHRRRRIRMRKPHPLLRQPVQIRRLVEPVPITP